MPDDFCFFGDSQAATEACFLTRLRSTLQLPEGTPLELERLVEEPDGSRTLEYKFRQAVALHGTEYGVADGVAVDEPSLAIARFGHDGSLKSSSIQLKDEHHLRTIQDSVRKLAESDAIDPEPLAVTGFTPPLSGVSGRLWRVETDSQGIKRLVRKRMA